VRRGSQHATAPQVEDFALEVLDALTLDRRSAGAFDLIRLDCHT